MNTALSSRPGPRRPQSRRSARRDPPRPGSPVSRPTRAPPGDMAAADQQDVRPALGQAAPRNLDQRVAWMRLGSTIVSARSPGAIRIDAAPAVRLFRRWSEAGRTPVVTIKGRRRCRGARGGRSPLIISRNWIFVWAWTTPAFLARVQARRARLQLPRRGGGLLRLRAGATRRCVERHRDTLCPATRLSLLRGSAPPRAEGEGHRLASSIPTPGGEGRKSTCRGRRSCGSSATSFRPR